MARLLTLTQKQCAGEQTQTRPRGYGEKQSKYQHRVSRMEADYAKGSYQVPSFSSQSATRHPTPSFSSQSATRHQVFGNSGDRADFAGVCWGNSVRLEEAKSEIASIYTQLTDGATDDDFPAAAAPDGTIWVACVAYQHGNPVNMLCLNPVCYEGQWKNC